MRVAVLSTPNSWYIRDLRRAAGARHTLLLCAFEQLHAALGSIAAPRVAVGTLDLADVDAVLVRTMPPGSLEQVVFRMNALARVERLGICVLNAARALEIAIDKYLALARLADAGLLVPETITCQTWQGAMEAYERLGGDVVVKPVFGGEGRGITRLNDPALALRAFKMLDQLGAVHYLQRYIPHCGHDLRLFVAGSRVLGMRRCNDVDWRTNVSRGARTEPIKVDDTLRQTAEVAARAVGTTVAGVDLLPGRDGRLYVLEVNAVPGWKALATTLRLDVAALVLDVLQQQVTEQASAARSAGGELVRPATASPRLNV